MLRSCTVTGCDRPHRARGLCGVHYCRAARARHRRPRWPSLEERMASRIDRSGGPDACWPWTGSRDARGYGRIRDVSRGPAPHVASRVAYELAMGFRLRDDEEVRHTCDNPPCCNPAHLLHGSHPDNMADAAARGRMAKVAHSTALSS